MKSRNSSIESSLFEAHIFQRVLQKCGSLPGTCGLETIFFVDRSPDSSRRFSVVSGESFRVDGQVDVVASVAGFAVNVAKVVSRFVVSSPRLQVGFGGFAQRDVDEIVA